MSNPIQSQVIDPYGEYNLDRTSLGDLVGIIGELEESNPNVARDIRDFVAHPIEVADFIETIFRHARDGFVQFRMFVDGDDKRTWGWPWKAVLVSDRQAMLGTATVLASKAALSPDRVNFCPPVATFVGPDKATKNDLCEGVAVVAECDERPRGSLDTLTALLGTPTLVVASGGVWRDPMTNRGEDKLHAYWRLSTPTRDLDEHQRLEEARDLASRIVSSDPTAKPSCHPLRWPGSWHKKSHPRLTRIVERNPDDQVDLDLVLMKLREAARERGVHVASDKPQQTQCSLGLKHEDGLWDLHKQSGHLVDAYLGLRKDRHIGLHGSAISIAMSAINKGYEITVGELADIAARLQCDNPPTNRYNDQELHHLAKDALGIAMRNVGDDPAYKRTQRLVEETTERYYRDMELEEKRLQREQRIADEPNDDIFIHEPDDQIVDASVKSDLRSVPGRGEASQAIFDRGQRWRTYWDEYENMPEIEYWDDSGFLMKKPEGTTMMATGYWGHHKTNVITKMVLDAVLDKGAIALYVACEGAYGLGKQRIPAFCKARGVKTRDLRDRFEFRPQGIILTDPKAVDDLIVNNQDFKPDIIIIDTLNQATPNVDSNSKLMGDLLGSSGPIGRIRKAFGCLVIILCHPPKSGGEVSYDSDISGHGSIIGNTDMILGLRYNKRTHLVSATIQRNKDGPEGGRLWFKIPQTGIPVPELTDDPDKNTLGMLKRNWQEDEASRFRIMLRYIRNHLKAEGKIFEGYKSHEMAAALFANQSVILNDGETKDEWIKKETKRLKNIQGRIEQDSYEPFRRVCVAIQNGEKRDWLWYLGDE